MFPAGAHVHVYVHVLRLSLHETNTSRNLRAAR
jgi:hypothetical protein